MRSVAVLAVLALVAVALAGCSSEDPERYPNGVSASSSKSTSGTASGSSTSTKSGSTSATGTSTGPSSSNHAPTAGLAIQKLNGTNVTFALTGSDVDNDTLSWDLAFGDNATTNGTSLPTNVTHSFAPGNHTVRLTMTDGHATGSANLTVSINATGGASGIPETYTFTGTATGAHDPVATGEGTGADIVQTFAVFGPIKSLTAKVSWTPGPPGTDLDLYVDDATGTERGSSACSNFAPAPFPLSSCNRGADEEVTITASAADAGDWKATISPFEAPNVTYTLTITFT